MQIQDMVINQIYLSDTTYLHLTNRCSTTNCNIAKAYYAFNVLYELKTSERYEQVIHMIRAEEEDEAEVSD